MVVGAGVAGAVAADMVAAAGAAERWRREPGGWALRLLGKLLVGSVAAVALLALNRSEEPWSLVGTGLAAGFGGEAVLLALLAVERARHAERELEHAVDVTSRLSVLSQARLAALADAARSMGCPEPADGLAELQALAGEFSREVALFAAIPGVRRRGTVRERVRGVLADVLGRGDVEGRPLREIGGAAAEARRLVAQELALEFPRSQPPFRPGDVTPEQTLDELVVEVQGRQG